MLGFLRQPQPNHERAARQLLHLGPIRPWRAARLVRVGLNARWVGGGVQRLGQGGVRRTSTTVGFSARNLPITSFSSARSLSHSRSFSYEG